MLTNCSVTQRADGLGRLPHVRQDVRADSNVIDAAEWPNRSLTTLRDSSEFAA